MFRAPWIGVAGLVLVVGGVFAATTWLGGSTERGDGALTDPALLRPPTVIPVFQDDAPVIGVSVGGLHRAYALDALMSPEMHICNDRLGPVPVTVAYCNLNNCVQVYSAPDRHEPLDIKLAGPDPTRARSMALKIGEYMYSHQSSTPIKPGDPAFPYTVTEYKRTTWSAWRKEHPDTDLYLGNLRLAPPDATTSLAPRR